MNDRCAAGCGRYLGYIADEMNMGLHELGPLAMKSTKTIRINSTCTVFAGAELRDRLSLGDKREDIMAGLHRAIILRAMSILARSGGIRNEFTFTGGVAKNEAAVKALRSWSRENYGELTLNINPDSIYTGALGGATFAWRAVVEEGKAVEDGENGHDHHASASTSAPARSRPSLFRTDGDRHEWLAKRCERIRRRDPMTLAQEGFDGVLADAGLAPADVDVHRHHRRGRERQVRDRPLLLDDHARARRRVPAARGARGRRHRRAQRPRDLRRRARQGALRTR